MSSAEFEPAILDAYFKQHGHRDRQNLNQTRQNVKSIFK
jgi:hypothetical protein